ncbi:MAG: alpha/beta hydrolase [Phycisphaerae bacterium]
MKRVVRWAARLFLLVLLALGLVMGLLAGCQDKLIFPAASSQGQPYAQHRPLAGDVQFTVISAAGDEVVGLFIPAKRPTSTPAPTLLMFYGNGQWLADAAFIGRAFAARGMNVAVMEYPGYGLSTGRASEAAIYAAADAFYKHVADLADVEAASIVPVGWSLGAAAAMYIAHRQNTPGVVLLTPFTSLPDMADRLIPLLPVRWLVKYDFDNTSRIAEYPGRVFIGYADRDRLIPSRMPLALAESAGDRATVYAVEGADHNTLFHTGGTALPAAIAAFVRQTTDAR